MSENNEKFPRFEEITISTGRPAGCVKTFRKVRKWKVKTESRLQKTKMVLGIGTYLLWYASIPLTLVGGVVACGFYTDWSIGSTLLFSIFPAVVSHTLYKNTRAVGLFLREKTEPDWLTFHGHESRYIESSSASNDSRYAETMLLVDRLDDWNEKVASMNNALNRLEADRLTSSDAALVRQEYTNWVKVRDVLVEDVLFMETEMERGAPGEVTAMRIDEFIPGFQGRTADVGALDLVPLQDLREDNTPPQAEERAPLSKEQVRADDEVNEASLPAFREETTP